MYEGGGGDVKILDHVCEWVPSSTPLRNLQEKLNSSWNCWMDKIAPLKAPPKEPEIAVHASSLELRKAKNETVAWSIELIEGTHC